MKVLVVGNGAREHAIAKKLAEEPIVMASAMAKLNPGIASLCKQNEIMDINKPENYEKFRDVDIAFVGPEAPLAVGVANKLEEMGVPTVGAVKETAKLEWSKAYARSVLTKNNIVGNPEYKICRNLIEVKEFLDKQPDVAVKPDVLTGGKGVMVTGQHLKTRAETEAYAAERIKSDGLVVLEEKLIGREFTLQAFSDGSRLKFMPLVRDFKRAYDNDEGPNTGSMGSFSCSDHNMPDLADAVVEKGKRIMQETIDAMRKTDGEYKGVLYGGFMTTKDDTYLIEYNCRFGDPEAMNVLSLLEKPLTEVGFGISEGKLPNLSFQKKATVCVYIVPDGYPDAPVKDQPLTVGEGIKSDIYYASVYDDNGVIKTTTSRAIALLGKGDSVSEARSMVYGDVDRVSGRVRYRSDIAAGIQ
ncbi:phosphoribosylamine--glycine ligase [Candidatus Bathyarchaeota archaeon]|nr:phosphoribosylamine--glycine ligase [Candidatus Bathyarchaeota archaeon]